MARRFFYRDRVDQAKLRRKESTVLALSEPLKRRVVIGKAFARGSAMVSSLLAALARA